MTKHGCCPGSGCCSKLRNGAGAASAVAACPLPRVGWDGSPGNRSWPWPPRGIALKPEAASDPQGAAGPALCRQRCLVLAVTVVPSFLPS